MRETRLSGSEGGGVAYPTLPTPIITVITNRTLCETRTYLFSAKNVATLDPPPAVTFTSAAVERRVRQPST